MSTLSKLSAPKISLLHATRGRPQQALEARNKWIEAAANPEFVEHIFAIDCDDEITIEALKNFTHRVVPEKGHGCVTAWNLAAEASTGDVLVQLSDDWIPSPQWDLQFINRIRDVSKPAVLRVSDGHRMDDLLCMAIFTRSWLEQLGTFLHSGYFGVYSDDEFSFRAYQSGVVIDARDLILEHHHPSFDPTIVEDETYQRQNNSKHYIKGRETFLKRNPSAMGRWLHQGTELRYYLPSGHDAISRNHILTVVNAPTKVDSPPPYNWRGLAYKTAALLHKKDVHTRLYRTATATAMDMLDKAAQSLRGRITIRSKHRGEINTLLSEWRSFKEKAEKDLPPEKTIEICLRMSNSAVKLMEAMRGNSWLRSPVDSKQLKSFRAQMHAQSKWWDSTKSMLATFPVEEQPNTRHPYDPPATPDGIPIYVISFNQLTYLRNTIRQLRRLGVKSSEIHIVDNHSALPPLLDYLDELEGQGCYVHRLPENFGPRSIFDGRAGLELPPVFAVSDPDLQFHPEMPSTFREDMLSIAAWCGTWKCGCALSLNDKEDFIKGTYFEGKSIAEWEAGFWNEPVPGWPPSLKRPNETPSKIYLASVDTTFAIYVRDCKHEDFLEGVRIAGSYEAHHLPWYAASIKTITGDTTQNDTSQILALPDKQMRVRPSPSELRNYRIKERSSTISKMAQEEAALEWITHRDDGYEFAISPVSSYLDWWRSEFSGEWNRDLFKRLRQLSKLSPEPVCLLDIGSWIGPIALWAAMRFEHVYCVEPDEAAREELARNIGLNRFEHCITILPSAIDLCPETMLSATKRNSSTIEECRFKSHEANDMKQINLSSFCEKLENMHEAANFIVRCSIGGGEEAVLADILAFVATPKSRTNALIISFNMDRWEKPEMLESLLEEALHKAPSLRDWQVGGSSNQTLQDVATIISYVQSGQVDTWVCWTKPDFRRES